MISRFPVDDMATEYAGTRVSQVGVHDGRILAAKMGKTALMD